MCNLVTYISNVCTQQHATFVQRRMPPTIVAVNVLGSANIVIRMNVDDRRITSVVLVCSTSAHMHVNIYVEVFMLGSHECSE